MTLPIRSRSLSWPGSTRLADFGDPFDESLLVYGVRTNEDRWAAVQAIEVTWDLIRLRYTTWEKPMPLVTITGGFSCPNVGVASFGALAEPGAATFVPSAALAAALAGTAAGGPGTGTAEPDPCVSLRRAIAVMVPQARTVLPTRSVRPSPPCHWRSAGSADGRARQ